jgi:dienelactone hydrolase
MAKLTLSLVLLAALLVTGVVSLSEESGPKIVTEAVTYRDGDVELEGWIAYDASRTGRRPGVLVIHEWWGLGDHPKRRAEALARLGYVAFACDMYGKGKRTDDPKVAGRWASGFRGENRLAGRSRARAGLDVLTKHERVDPARVAAMGYCFGGTIALELAWSGAPLVGAVSFHGHPTSPREQDLAGVRAAILVCHGADDGFVPDEMLATFERTMREGKIDWQLIKYGGAVHSFTNQGADAHGIPGVAYHEKADRRSWSHMETFFEEVLE